MFNMESPAPELSAEEETRWRQNEAHGELLCSRLSRLMERGYRPNTDLWTYTFDLIHPSKLATPVQLWPDGQLVDRSPTNVIDGQRTIIGPDDEERFKRFLQSVPKPTAMQKFMVMTIYDAAVIGMAFAILFAFSVASYYGGRALWRLITAS